MFSFSVFNCTVFFSLLCTLFKLLFGSFINKSKCSRIPMPSTNSCDMKPAGQHSQASILQLLGLSHLAILRPTQGAIPADKVQVTGNVIATQQARLIKNVTWNERGKQIRYKLPRLFITNNFPLCTSISIGTLGYFYYACSQIWFCHDDFSCIVRHDEKAVSACITASPIPESNIWFFVCRVHLRSWSSGI